MKSSLITVMSFLKNNCGKDIIPLRKGETSRRKHFKRIWWLGEHSRFNQKCMRPIMPRHPRNQLEYHRTTNYNARTRKPLAQCQRTLISYLINSFPVKSSVYCRRISSGSIQETLVHNLLYLLSIQAAKHWELYHYKHTIWVIFLSGVMIERRKSPLWV